MDGNVLWMQRLSLYENCPPARTAGSSNTEVPKTLGVAICSATGLKTYFSADSLNLKAHGEIPGMFNCDKFFEVFKQADAATQPNLLENCRNGGCKRLQLVRDWALGKNKFSGEEIRALYESARRKKRDGGLGRMMASTQENCLKAALKRELKIIRDDFRL